MLHTDIFVSESLCLVLRSQQGLVHLAAHIDTGIAAMDFCQPFHSAEYPVGEGARVDAHLLDQLQDQTVLQHQQAVEQMLLLDLLIAVLISQFLALIDRFNRFLRKFLYIHGITSSHRISERNS